MINDALDPLWRGTKEDTLPPIPHYNNKVFAIQRKIINQILEVHDYHWVDKNNNLPPLHHQRTDTYRIFLWRLATDHENEAIAILRHHETPQKCTHSIQ